MFNAILISVAVVVMMIIVYAVLRSRRLLIKNPSIVFYDVTGVTFSSVLEEDKSALSGLFPCVTISRNGVDRCDVLFLYAHFSADGKIEGADASLREIIHAAGAKIVVVASANSSSSYTNPARSREFVRANLVLTTDRRGECFPRFCSSLFSKMKSGLPMTTAWTAVAPQGLESEHRDLPFTIFLCELGALRFKYGALRG